MVTFSSEWLLSYYRPDWVERREAEEEVHFDVQNIPPHHA